MCPVVFNYGKGQGMLSYIHETSLLDDIFYLNLPFFMHTDFQLTYAQERCESET